MRLRVGVPRVPSGSRTRTKGNVLTRGRSTYKKRGPKPKPRSKRRYYVKTGGKGGRRRNSNSRRSLAKTAANKRAETLARKRAQRS